MRPLRSVANDDIKRPNYMLSQLLLLVTVFITLEKSSLTDRQLLLCAVVVCANKGNDDSNKC